MEVLAGMLFVYGLANVVLSGPAFKVFSSTNWIWWEYSVFFFPFFPWFSLVISIEGKSLSNAFVEPAALALCIAPFVWARFLIGDNWRGKSVLVLGTMVAMGAGAVITCLIPGLPE